MNTLSPCDACHRHAAVDDRHCPFCGAALRPHAHREGGPIVPPRLKRAATFAFSSALAASAGASWPAGQAPSADRVAWLELAALGSPGVIYGADPQGRRVGQPRGGADGPPQVMPLPSPPQPPRGAPADDTPASPLPTRSPGDAGSPT